MPFRRLLPLLLVALVAGLVLGVGSDRFLDRGGAGTRAPRPRPLEQAWRALERNDMEALGASLQAIAPAAMPTQEYAAEVRLLGAVHRGDRERVATLAEEGVGRVLGAQALAWLIDTAPDAAERQRLEGLLRERYPESWRVERAKAAGESPR